MNVKMRVLHKVISAAFLGILLGVYIRHDYLRWGKLGREAFLANESHRFDQFTAHPHSAAEAILGGVVALVAIVGIYELMAFGLSWILRSAPHNGSGAS